MTGEPPVKEWNFNPDEILASPRKVKGIFHQPVVDKDGEIINSKGIRDAVPDFMHLPALHDFHKERPVGLATKVQELGGGRFYMEGVIKSTHDCDDVWEKVQTGNYGQMSIFGKRTKYNNQCALPQSMRSGPCITDGVRLDSISICDDNARNPQTSLEMMKAKTVFDAEELRKSLSDRTPSEHEGGSIHGLSKLVAKRNRDMGSSIKDTSYSQSVRQLRASDKDEEKKAETAGDSVLMHASTDYAGGKVKIKKCPRCNKPKEDPVTTISKENVKKAEGDNEPDYEKPTVRYRPPKEKHVPNEANEPEPRTPYKSRDQSGKKPGKLVRGINVHSKIEEKESEKKPEPKTHRTPEPDTYRETERRTTAGHALRHYEGEAMKEKMAVAAKKTSGEEKKTGHKVGSTRITPQGRTRAEKERMSKPSQVKPEHGAATAQREATGAEERHRIMQTKFDKADTMDDDVEKGGVRPKITQERSGPEPARRKGLRKDIEVEPVRHEGRGEDPHHGRLEKAEDEAEMEKSAAEDLEDENYDEDEDKDFKHAKPSDKEGNWNKSKNPNGTPGLKKAKADKGPDEKDEENEEDQEEEYEEEYEEETGVEKAIGYAPNVKPLYREKGPQTVSHLKDKPRSESIGTRARQQGKKTTTSRVREQVSEPGKTIRMNPDPAVDRSAQKDMRDERLQRFKKGDEDGSSELFDPSTVTKGEQMVDETEQGVEYVTKALVPIEDIDTIVKARTEEISKAYMGRLDEITKAYDEKIDKLAALVEKMGEETIRKGGSVVVIRELLDGDGSGAMSNADAVAKMQAGR